MNDLTTPKGCFTCDTDIVGVGNNMVSAVTSFTKTSLLHILRNLIGDEFVVVVSQHDRVCSNCFSLFDKIDELELQLKHVQSVLSGHLIKKYAAFSERTSDNEDENIPVRKKRRVNVGTDIAENFDGDDKTSKECKNLQNTIAIHNQIQNCKFCCACKIEFPNMRDIKNHVTQRHMAEEEVNIDERSISTPRTVFKCCICSKTFLNKTLCRNHVLKLHLTPSTLSYDFNVGLSPQNINSAQVSIQQHNDSILNKSNKIEQHSCTESNHEIVVNKYNATTNVEINVINTNSDNSLRLNNSSDLKNSSHQDNVNCVECKLLVDKLRHNKDNSVEDSNLCVTCKTCGRQLKQSSIHCAEFSTDETVTETFISDIIKRDDQRAGDNLRTINILCNKISTGLPSPLKNEINSIAENMAVKSINSLKNNIQEFINLLDSNVSTNEILNQLEPKNDTNCVTIFDLKEEIAYKCKFCDVSFESQISLNKHYQDLHKNDTINLICVTCNERFEDYSLLNTHITDCHPSQNNGNNCQTCNLNCDDKEELISHVKNVHITDKLCPICGKRFKKEAIFLKHIEYDHRDNLFCRVCKMQFSCVKELIAHEKSHIKKEFVCDTCCKVLKTRSSLKAHQITMHTRNYPYICEMCGKGFISTHSLNEHKGRHSLDSRYICDICGKGYRLYDTYHKHRNHHDNPYPKQCTTCKQRFRSSSRLAEHMRRKHTFERPYKCPYCPLSFHISSLLKHHLFKHTRQYPYTCASCKKGFPSRIKFAIHMEKKHKDDTLIKNRHPNNKERQEEWLKCSR